MGALKDIYEVVFDLAIKANLPTKVANLRGKLEQLEKEHEREVQQLEQQIKKLETIVQQSCNSTSRGLWVSPPLSSEKSKPDTASERIAKDDLPLDAQGW